MAYHGFKPAEQAIQIGDDEILSSHISDGVIVNADVNASAAIATSKVSGAVTSIGSHGLGSLATLSAVASAQITDGTIVNADVNNSAAIATSKLSGSLTSVGSHGLATSATTDTTNASNISSGTLAAARVATLNQNTTGQAGTVATITGLAPDTATTQATQGAITSAANLATVGTITTGVWNAGALTTSGDVILTGGGSIYSDSSDGNDDDIISISGGGAVSDTRGGRIDLRGNEAGGGLGGTVRLIAGNTAEGDISFYTAGAVNMTIENGGKVGIGTTSPNTTVGMVQIEGSSQNYNNSPMITFKDTAGQTNSRNWSIGCISDSWGNFVIGRGANNSDFLDSAADHALTISYDGKVGIGTTSPDMALSVKGSGATQAIFGQDRTSGFSYIYLGEEATGDKCLVFGYDHDNNWGGFCIGGEQLGTGGLNIADGGNVGIGTASPDVKLHIDSGGNNNVAYFVSSDRYAHINIADSGTTHDVLLGADNGAFFLNTGNVHGRIAVDTDGKVGIGTTSPANKLHVSDAGQNTVMRIGNNGNYDQYIYFNGANDWCVGMDDSDSQKFKISGHSSFAGTDDFLTINTSGTATFSGSNEFNVSGAGGATNYLMLNCFSTTPAHCPSLVLMKSHSNTVGVVGHTGNGHVLGLIEFAGKDTGGSWEDGAHIKVTATGDGTLTSIPCKMEFATSQSASVRRLALTLGDDQSATFTGAVSKSSGSFKIDHPLPSKKDTHYLVHSFAESPRADLIYRDKVTLVDGSATVNIDTVAGMTEGTFVLLCDDVQCFTSNESDWKAVKGSVTENILTIECEDSNSTADIAWMVIGDRKDKHIMETSWTDENGKPIIEPEKENA